MDNNKLIILTDKSRLQEIYNLRVEAWEQSKSNNIINHEKYPDGFTDEFDDESIHLIATDENDSIKSACRVTFFKDLSNYPYIGLNHIEGFPVSNFALIGRGVRNKDFKFKRLQYEFVTLAITICKQYGIEKATGHAYHWNIYMQNLMLDLGFTFLCNVGVDNYRNQNFAYPGKLFMVDTKK